MHADQNRRRSLYPSNGHSQVVLKLRDVFCSPLRFVPLAASDGGNLGANHAVVNKVQSENRHAGIVAGALEIAIYEDLGEVLPRTSNKIHRKKSDITDDIDVP